MSINCKCCFFKDSKYIEPLLLTIAIYRHTELLLRGIRMFLNRLADPKELLPLALLSNDCIDFASELWEKITPNEAQIKRFNEGYASSDMHMKAIKGRNSKAIEEARRDATIYKEWLEKQICCYRDKRSN